jgi:hypothetical protein
VESRLVALGLAELGFADVESFTPELWLYPEVSAPPVIDVSRTPPTPVVSVRMLDVSV